MVSRTGNVGSTVSKWVKCPNLSLAETIKGVGSFWQQDGGHGSWNPLRSA